MYEKNIYDTFDILFIQFNLEFLQCDKQIKLNITGTKTLYMQLFVIEPHLVTYKIVSLRRELSPTVDRRVSTSSVTAVVRYFVSTTLVIVQATSLNKKNKVT